MKLSEEGGGEGGRWEGRWGGRWEEREVGGEGVDKEESGEILKTWEKKKI